MDEELNIPGRTAANSRFTVSGRTQARPVVDPGRNLQFDPRTLLQTSVASTISARTFDDLSGPATSRTGLGNLEETPSRDHLSPTLTGGTGHCFGAGLGTSPMATPAGILVEQLNLFLATNHRRF